MEILAPAGDIEKLKTALLYGADAAYFSFQKFGLRYSADNFTLGEIEEATKFAHERNCKVFITVNAFLHDSDLEEIEPFFSFLDEIQVDAIIVSDIGVISIAKEYPNIVVHLSTQTSTLNASACEYWARAGVKRVVLGREVSIKEAQEIKELTGLEVEMFVHGSMCMAYSGNCVISNYTHGRDSNRGGCAHSCRFLYELTSKDSDEVHDSYFMSSKDLYGLDLLNDFFNAKIDSLKIEGRMKSLLYVATVSKVYSEAKEAFLSSNLDRILPRLKEELNKVTHRAYSQASLIEPATVDSIFDEREHVEGDWQAAGVIVDVFDNSSIFMNVKSNIFLDDFLEILPFKGEAIALKLSTLKRVSGEEISKASPGTVVIIPFVEGVEKRNVVRVRRCCES